VILDTESGELRLGKSLSTPRDPDIAVLRALSDSLVSLRTVERFRHGATIATNTALERAGATLGVVTTEGFRDVLIIGKGNRTKLYDIKAVRPRGLVKRAAVREVAERLGPQGQVLQTLDEGSVHTAAENLKQMGVDSIAVCFLHAYANPEHEQRTVALLSEHFPDVPVCRSSEVLAEHREYERFSTTALNAYVAPRMGRYLARLRERLDEQGLRVSPEIMSSSGGSWSFEEMARLPVNSMLSGPAGGVIGALELAKQLELENLITYDMGGTSTDTCLIMDGQYPLAAEGFIGGLPNRAPQIEINTVGAGGGSLAYLDDGGFLNVGPRSAGAVPGPACYGKGGIEPTVTDANVVLGRFRPAEALGGEITIDVAAAEAAVDTLAAKLNLTRFETAEGIIRIAVARMTGAIKEISVMRGIDPREFSLFAFGGAGPLHAALIAAELDMPHIVVPPLSGAFSAYGLLMAERRKDRSKTHLRPLRDAQLAELAAEFRPLEQELIDAFAAEGFDASALRFERSVDLRFEGQAFELTTPFQDGWTDLEPLREAFNRLYVQRYSHADEGDVETVAFRVAAIAGNSYTPSMQTAPSGSSTPQPQATDTRECWMDGKALEAKSYERSTLEVNARIDGPALIDENGAATLLPPNCSATVHGSGALILKLHRPAQGNN